MVYEENFLPKRNLWEKIPRFFTGRGGFSPLRRKKKKESEISSDEKKVFHSFHLFICGEGPFIVLISGLKVRYARKE